MRQSAINRILLALAGTVMLGSGVLMLAGGFDVYRRWSLSTPDGVPWTAPDAVVLEEADRTRWTEEAWWWPAVIAALVVVFLLALWWLLAQLHRTHPGHMELGEPPVDGVELREHALSDALAADAGRQPGVTGAQARMIGPPRRPKAQIDLTLTRDSEPGPVLRTLCDGPLARARRSTGRTRLPAEARMRITPHKPHRAE